MCAFACHYLDNILPFLCSLQCFCWVRLSPDSLIWAPLYVISCFSLAAFKIISLSLNFAIFIMICLGVTLYGFILIGTLCTSWACMTFSLIKLRKFSVIIFSNRFSMPCSPSSPSGNPMIWVLSHFRLCCNSLKPSSSFLVFFHFVALSGNFLLSCPPGHWFDPLLQLACF